MFIGRVDSGVYQLLFILHILAVIVAFAPAVVHPLMGNRLRSDGAAVRSFSVAASAATRTVYLPALVLVGVLGFGLIAVSDGAYEFSEPWVGAAILLWLIIAAVVGAVILPAERLLATGDAGGEPKLRAGGGVVSLLLVVVLFLMVVKPG